MLANDWKETLYGWRRERDSVPVAQPEVSNLLTIHEAQPTQETSGDQGTHVIDARSALLPLGGKHGLTAIVDRTVLRKIQKAGLRFLNARGFVKVGDQYFMDKDADPSLTPTPEGGADAEKA